MWFGPGEHRKGRQKGPYHCVSGTSATSGAFLNEAHIHYSEHAAWDAIDIDSGTIDIVIDGSWSSHNADS